MALSKNDKTSFSNTEDFICRHNTFNWEIDFDKKRIHGSVRSRFEVLNKNASHLILDAKHLEISKILVGNAEAVYEIAALDVPEFIGSKLSIQVGAHAASSDSLEIEIFYSTTEGCSALQWMAASMTLGKTHPYLYSQCEAIHARSLFPCQDSPFSKSTFSAKVSAKKGRNVLMSAIYLNSNASKSDATLNEYHFEQKIAIPSYLVAIACGNIAGKKIGPRSTVWTEPEMLEKAAYEFAELEQTVKVAERLVDMEYKWGVCDLLILPPTFPYGGMENPCLVFLTPTLLVGDRSLCYVVGHEIAHSWTGNLVTNSNWEDFWLNEGHTTYLERLIVEGLAIEKLKSASKEAGGGAANEEEIKRQGYLARCLEVEIGRCELQDAMAKNGANHAFNQLCPTVESELIDPDDYFSVVPYEKGSLLLLYLEQLCGRDNLMAWLSAYLKQFQGQSLNRATWKQFFLQFMKEKRGISSSILEQIDWEGWFFGKNEIPDVELKIERCLYEACDKLARFWMEEWQDGREAEWKARALSEYSAMTQQQVYLFYQLINSKYVATFDEAKLKAMLELYKLENEKNWEVRFEWLFLSLRSRFAGSIEPAFLFLREQGRLKYTRRIFRMLHEWDATRARTEQFLAEQKPFMSPILFKMICGDLKIAC